jgi:excisionase family DNA binding protein
VTAAGSHAKESRLSQGASGLTEVRWVPELVQHLTSALSGHVRRLTALGLPVPPEVEELAVFLRRVARARHDPPSSAGARGNGHYSRMPDPLLISKDQAAERLGVSVRTVERLVATGRLPQVHLERLARFRVKDIEAFVDGLPESRPDADGERTG